MSEPLLRALDQAQRKGSHLVAENEKLRRRIATLERQAELDVQLVNRLAGALAQLEETA